MAYTPNNPYIPGDPYSYDLKWIISQLKSINSTIAGLDDKIQAAVIAALDQHAPIYYGTAAELIASGQKAGSIAYIEGYFEAGDGGANLYYVTEDYNDIINASFYLTMDGANKWALPVILTPYVTPEMFGAKGDGITDDTDAVKLAFNFHSIIAKNTYMVKRIYFTGSFNHILDGNNTGAFLLAENNANIFQIDASDGSFIVKNCEFNGNNFAMASPGGGLIQCNTADIYLENVYIHDFKGSNSSNAVSGGGSSMIAKNCKIINCASGPYFLGKVKNIVENCYIEDCLAGVQLSSTEHAVIKGNTFYNNQNDVTCMTTYTADIKDIIIENNHFINTRGSGEYGGAIVAYVNKPITDTKIDLIISNNIFDDILCAAVSVGQIGIPQNLTDTINGVKIVNNIINMTVDTGSSTPGAFTVMSASNVFIENNIITKSGTKNINAIYFRGKRFTGAISFNKFIGNFSNFINNSGTVTDLNIELDLIHNTMSDPITWLLTIGTSTITTNSYIRVINAANEIEYTASDFITSTFYNHTHVDYIWNGTYRRYLISANNKGAGMICHVGSTGHFYYYDIATSSYKELTTQTI